MKSIGPYVISATPHGAMVGGHPATAQAGSSRGQDSLPSRKGQAPGSGGSPAGSVLASRPLPTRDLPAAEPGRSAPMHGIDRLTGMPVLLHRLSEFVVPSATPESPSLLPVYEVDIWDGQPYAITELPLAAIPATHPGSAALGALRALSALHAAGQVHGGLNAGQLWQVGGEVRLAGAGLPWQPGASAAGDLSALGQALDSLGARPAALNNLETMTADQALAVLEEALGAARQQSRALNDWPKNPHQDERQETRHEEPGAPLATPGFGPPATPAPVDRKSVVPDALHATRTAAAQMPAQMPAQPPVQATQGTPNGSPAARSGLSQTTPPSGTAAAPPEAQEASAHPIAYRSANDILVIGEQEPAPQTAPSAATLPTVRLIPAPIRIGFDEPPAPLPDWTPGPGGRAEPSGRPQTVANTAALPVALPADPDPSDEGTTLGRVTRFVPAASPATPASAARSGQRGPPLRIGWEEDHSWRVVKSGPDRRFAVPRMPAGTPRRAVLALLLAVLGGAAIWLVGRSGGTTAGCCTQRFTVSGSSQPVQVTVVQAPPGSPIQPGALLGTAPGVLNFPNIPGRYTLRFTAAGHAALTGTVTVPSGQAFGIALK